jgi:hypothetical protein
MPEACPVYRPRKPHLTPFYQCVQDHFDTFEQVYEERFAKCYGFWRPYLKAAPASFGLPVDASLCADFAFFPSPPAVSCPPDSNPALFRRLFLSLPFQIPSVAHDSTTCCVFVSLTPNYATC